MASNVLTFDDCHCFRQRLVLATLSGRSVKIRKIRSKENDPGLKVCSITSESSIIRSFTEGNLFEKNFEACFIRLLDKITNGSKIVVSETGTNLFYQPGLLLGGEIDHDCCPQRSIGYYLEGLVCLAPFVKRSLRVLFKGVTNDQTDPSVDIIKLSVLPVLKKFLGDDEGLELKINKRGAAPEGGGEVLFSCPCKQKLRTLQFTDPGKIKRIRGVAWAVRVSPASVNRIVDSARGILNQFLPDIYIYTDHHKGSASGKSPGFGLTLVAETTNGAFLSAESSSNPKGSDQGPTVPEELGAYTAKLLLEEIYRGGCVDSTAQSIAAVMMVCGQQDVCKIQTGSLSPYTISYLRNIKDFFQVMFKVDSVERSDEDEDLKLGGEKLILTCVGVGYTNISKRIM